jgi:F-box interacting protein
VISVLLLLPARTLARFRCVCRSWNNQITSPSFQESHHALASSVGLPLKFAFLPMAPAPCIKHFPGCKGCPRLVGTKPCRGVVLVERRCGGKFSVCNPSTGGVLNLPPPPRVNFIDDVFHCAGIGFHAPTGEYKVVNLRVNDSDKARCNVLTVSDDSAGAWRSLAAADQFLADSHVFVDKDVDPVFATGCLHWMFRTGGTRYDEPHGILSFSLADEYFRRAPQPSFSTADLALLDYESTDPRRSRVGFTSSCDTVIMPAGRALAELDGSLCIVRDVRRRNDVERLFEIWKLQDYEAGSWTMDYSISLASGVVAEQLTKPWLVVPICYIGGSKIVLVTSAHKVHVYDPNTNALHILASPDDMEKPRTKEPSEFLRFVLYQESLVQLDDMEHADRKIKFVKL